MSSDAVSVLYALGGIFALYTLIQRRHSFFDRYVTREDVQLAWMATIFLLTPFGVLVHEMGHYFAAKYQGITEVELHHRGYWGFVSYTGSAGLDTSTRLFISGAGPLVGVVLGYLCIGAALVLPVRQIFRHLLAIFGIFEVFHHLVGYPLIDLLGDRNGDFQSIYGLLPTYGMILAGAIHGALCSLMILIWQHRATKWLVNP